MKNVVLQDLLQEITNRGDKELGQELAAFLEATTKAKSIPYSTPRKMLAQAAKKLRDGEISLAHDYLGAATEAYLKEKAGEIIELPKAVTASLTQELAPLHVFKEIENITIPEESPDFDKTPQELVSAFANLLLKSGYIDEARKYLTAFNTTKENEEGNETMSTKQALKDLQKKYKKGGDFVRAKALEEVIADLDEETEEEEEVEAPKADDAEAAKKVEEPCDEGEPCESENDPYNKPWPDSANPDGGKPVLEVEAPSKDEEDAKEEAQACIVKGQIKKAKKALAKAANLERLRLTAALIKAGDMELALQGLVEAEGEEDPVQDEKNAGLKAPVSEEDDEEAPVDEAPVHTDDEAPSEDEMEKRQDEAVEEEEKTEEPSEKEVASAIAKATKKALRKKDMKTVIAGLKDLEELEKAIVAGVEKAEKKLKDEALAKEGYAAWKEVRAINLNTIKIVAEAEGDEDEVEKAALGLEALEDDDVLDDTLDSEPENEGSPEPEPKEGFDTDYDDEGSEDSDSDSEEDEADGMKYETLQSVDSLKNMKVDREALAFTYWENANDPFWTIQAHGKPVGEVHLQDQNDPEDVKAFFCDQSKWPNVIAQSTEKIGLYEMMKGVKARFYANAITKGALAQSLKTEVEASLKNVRTEKLATLKKDFIESVTLSAEALNKGLITGKTNPLKKSFVDKLASLGFSHPALVVEECFASAFKPYFEQIVSDAEEYLAMPKEALAHTKRMITSATNVAVAQASNFANETMSERLSRNSMPLMSTSEAYNDVDEVNASIRKFSAREQKNNLKAKLKLSNKF
jgi:hypothetical protein